MVYKYATKATHPHDNAISMHNRDKYLNELSDLSFVPNIRAQEHAPARSVSPFGTATVGITVRWG